MSSRALKVKTRTLNCTLKWTGNQCSCWSSDPIELNCQTRFIAPCPRAQGRGVTTHAPVSLGKCHHNIWQHHDIISRLSLEEVAAVQSETPPPGRARSPETPAFMSQVAQRQSLPEAPWRRRWLHGQWYLLPRRESPEVLAVWRQSSLQWQPQ